MQITAPTRFESLSHARSQHYSAHSNSPLKDRVTCDWKKSFLIATMATVIAEIALAFFLKLPMVALIFSVVGIGCLILYRWSVQAESKLPTVSDYNDLKTKIGKMTTQLQQTDEKHTATLSKVQDEANKEKERLQQQHDIQLEAMKKELELTKEKADVVSKKDEEITGTIKGQADALMTEKQQLNEEIEGLRKEIKELRENPPEALKAAKMELAQLQEKIQKLSQECSEKESAVKKVDEKTGSLRVNFNKLKTQLEQQRAESEQKFKDKLQRLKTDCELMYSNLSTAEEEYRQMKEKLESARAEYAQIQEKIHNSGLSAIV